MARETIVRVAGPDLLGPEFPARAAVATGDVAALDEVDGADDPQPLLLRCAAAGFVAGIEWCLRRGDAIDLRGLRGWTALHTAAAFAQRPAVEMLLAEGADDSLDEFGCSVRWVGLSSGRDRDLDEWLATGGMALGESAKNTPEMSRLHSPRHVALFLNKSDGIRALTKTALVLGRSARLLKPLFDNNEAIATVELDQIRRVAHSAIEHGFGLGWQGHPDPMLDPAGLSRANIYWHEGEKNGLTQRMITPSWPPDWLRTDRAEGFDGKLP